MFCNYQEEMVIVNQLLQFYLLISMRNQQPIFVIIVKASTLIVHSAVPIVLPLFRVETSCAFFGVTV